MEDSKFGFHLSLLPLSCKNSPKASPLSIVPSSTPLMLLPCPIVSQFCPLSKKIRICSFDLSPSRFLHIRTALFDLNGPPLHPVLPFLNPIPILMSK